MQMRQRAEGSHQTLGYVTVGHHFTGQHCVQQLGEFLAVHLVQRRGTARLTTHRRYPVTAPQRPRTARKPSVVRGSTQFWGQLTVPPRYA
ncbi:MAG: hypothetical protein ACRDTD_27200, partial [Pseudonocardiaceae bacterium]